MLAPRLAQVATLQSLAAYSETELLKKLRVANLFFQGAYDLRALSLEASNFIVGFTSREGQKLPLHQTFNHSSNSLNILHFSAHPMN
jgi:hypothetical protein